MVGILLNSSAETSTAVVCQTLSELSHEEWELRNGAPVAPPSTISSTALTYEESSEARKSTALASSCGSPQQPSKFQIERDVNTTN